ncbi:metal ABC transporter substrate-binding protein [Staphylococcus chromogenes]|nr:metal ABC transporter substrate-binding protein [Staphylococcus chromogenes]
MKHDTFLRATPGSLHRLDALRKIAVALCALTALLLASACSAPGHQETDRPVIYASFYPIYSLVHTIAGEDADVRTFMPQNQDPHLWEPSPKDIQALSHADMLVVNGANMEPWLPHIQEVIPNLKVLNLSDYVELINYKGAAALGEFQYIGRMHVSAGTPVDMVFGHTHERELRAAFFKDPGNLSRQQLQQRGREVMNDQGIRTEQHASTQVKDGQVYAIRMGHEKGDVSFTFPEEGDWVFVSDRTSEDILSYSFANRRGNAVELDALSEGGSAKSEHNIFDPHSWLSLVNAKRYANAINGELRTLAPEHEDDFDARTRSLIAELTHMQAHFKAKLKAVEHREFLTNHNAFAYVARDYDLKQYPLQGLTTQEAPKLRVLTDAIRTARRSDIHVVFYESGSDPKTANVIANEIDGTALPLCSMEYGPPDAEHQTYTEIVRMNLDNLATALIKEGKTS